MSLPRSTSKSKFIDTPKSSDIEPSIKKNKPSIMTSQMTVSESAVPQVTCAATENLNPAACAEYIAHAVCDPDLPTSTKRQMYQALMLNKAATESGQTNNSFINMQLAASAGAAIYGPQYSKWVQASYQGTTMGLPAPPPPAMQVPSSNQTRSRNKPKRRGRARNN